ncbi:MAG TPA: enoyl-CoA hydratase [Moraxellaceae bacterium]
MSSEFVVTSLESRILTIRLNRADKKNALTSAMYTALRVALEEAAANAEVRVVLFTGSDGVFCSGNDLQDFLELAGDIQETPVARFLRTLSVFPKPVVAAVEGPAIGIGTTLLLHCDLVYAARGARLQLPFASLGLCPEFASSYLLPRILGHVRAAELLMLGDPFTAEKALEYGLVNEVLEPAELAARALSQAQRLATQAPEALRTTKMLMKRFNGESLRESIHVEMGHFGELLKGEELKEAVSAFRAKRKPDFSRFD